MKSQSSAVGLLFGCFLLSLSSSSSSSSEVYSNAINTSSWKAKSSVFECSLVHGVPFYGDAVFRTRAGEASGFCLRAKTSRFKAGEAKMVASSPVWVSSPVVEELAVVGMKKGRRPLWLGTTLAERMLAKLNAGMEVGLEHGTWYDSSASQAKLAMSTIGFRRAYDEYLACLSSLIPQNFDQLKRTALMFPGGETDELPRSVTSKLDNILQLVKYDAKVRVFYLDGHTDSEGDRDENLELSKKRVELVSAYLTRRGVPEDWIVMRWHGERYPVASNANASGRARNRRVSIRLERVEEIEVLPLASNS